MTGDRNAAVLPVQRGGIWRRAAVLGILCAALAALVTADAVHEAVLELLAVGEQIIARHPVLGAMFVVAFAAISAMLAFVSTALIVPVAVYAWGEPFSMLLLWLGWILGGVLSYGVGRLPGRAMVRWMTAGDTLLRMEGRIGRHASFGLVLLFQLALPSEIPGYLLGLVRYSPWKYLLALGLAELPYAIATIHMGAGFVERRSGQLLAVGLAVIVLSVAAFQILRKRLAAEAQASSPGLAREDSPRRE